METDCGCTHSVQLAMLDPMQIKVDADAYQFRKGGDKNGVTAGGRFKIEQWDPILHGDPLLVHQRLDGSYYVVDGHHHLDEAKRLQCEGGGKGPSSVAAMILREADGYTVDDMKIIGAYKNMNAGRATPVEGARVFKEVAEQVKAGRVHPWLLPNLSMDKSNLRLSCALTPLCDCALKTVESGEVPLDVAVLVAQKLPDPSRQKDVMLKIAANLKQDYAIHPATIIPPQGIAFAGATLVNQPSIAGQIMGQRFVQAAAVQAVSLN